jgi:hypothetical protein
MKNKNDHISPTLENQLWWARKLDQSELQRHAYVSLYNRCHCGECFCCACVIVLRERKEISNTHNRLLEKQNA